MVARGFTLIELIIFVVVVGIATTGLFLALNRANLASVEPISQLRAFELAQSVAETIIGKNYDEMSPNGGFPPCDSAETDAQPCDAFNPADKGELDDVDDYDGYSTLPAGYDGFSLNVSVTAANLNGQSAKYVLIQVQPAAGNPVQLGFYRANY